MTRMVVVVGEIGSNPISQCVTSSLYPSSARTECLCLCPPREMKPICFDAAQQPTSGDPVT